MSRAPEQGASVAAEPPDDDPLAFPRSCTVASNSKVSRLRVRVPVTKPAGGADLRPPFLQFETRLHPKLRKLSMRPVLSTQEETGNTGSVLTVSESLKWLAPGPVIAREASQFAYRWYRLTHSSGPLVCALFTVIGALLVAYGAIHPDTSLGIVLLIAGGVLTIVAVALLVISAWRAPAD